MEISDETRVRRRLHGKVAARIGARLARYVEEHGLGETYVATGFDLGTILGAVVAPDIAFVVRDRLASDEEEDGYHPGAPDLAIEVVESDDSFYRVDAMLGDLMGAGCRMMVIINPIARSATVFRSSSRGCILTIDGVLDGGDIVPGWKLPLREVFE